MIITLKNADFSENNVGQLNSWFIFAPTVSGGVVTADPNNPSSIDKTTLPATTLKYTFDTAKYNFISCTPSVGTVTHSNGTITVTIPQGTTIVANITISIALERIGGDTGGEEEDPVNPPSGGTTTTTLPLAQGYIDKGVVNNELNTRVRSDGLAYGPFSVEVNSGYLIRAIYEHTKADLTDGGTAIVASADEKTSYSGGQDGKYYAFTFCKTSASATLSPTENIIKSFSGTIVPIETSGGSSDGGTTTNPEAGTDVAYTLVQGAHVQNDSSIYQGTNRVTTPKAIKGKFTVTVNSGYAIRAVYEYTKESGDTNGTMVSETSTDKTTFTSTNANKYYGVTFTKAGSAANDTIAPTENIVAS